MWKLRQLMFVIVANFFLYCKYFAVFFLPCLAEISFIYQLFEQ